LEEDTNELLKQMWDEMESLPAGLRHEARLGFLNGLLAALETKEVEDMRAAFADKAVMKGDFLDLIDGHLALREIMRR